MAFRWLGNERSDRTPQDEPGRDALAFHRKLPGYSPSPLVRADSLAQRLGLSELWVKDESSRFDLPSFKILGASWAVYRALVGHLGGLRAWSKLDELVEAVGRHRAPALAAATDGNHGRAVARMANLLGLEARIFVPEGTARARIEAIRSEGASCEVVHGTYDDAVTRSAQEASDRCLVISDTSWPGYEDVPRWVIDGYSTIFWEISDELAARSEPSPDLVMIQMGVGALGAAAARHFRASSNDITLVGVEPSSAACVLISVEAGEIAAVPGPHDSIMAGLNCGTPSLIAWPVLSAAYDAFLAIDDEAAREGMRLLAGSGIVSGETGAAGLGGLLELCARPELRDALGVHGSTRALILSTEGATDPEGYESVVGSPPRGVSA